MSARLDAILFGAACGTLSERLGYDYHSWPFWLVAMPLSVFYGFMRGLRG